MRRLSVFRFAFWFFNPAVSQCVSRNASDKQVRKPEIELKVAWIAAVLLTAVAVCPLRAQTPPPPVLGTTSLLVGAGGGTYSVLLNDSGTWTATSNAAFLHVATASQSGTGNALIVFTCDPNSGTTPQTGTLTIAGLTLTVTQAGTDYIGQSSAVSYSPVSSPGLYGLVGVAVDTNGNVYYDDVVIGSAYEWSPSTQQDTLLIPSGLISTDGEAVALDSSGNLYVADPAADVIDEWNASTQQVSVLVSSGLNDPQGIAIDLSGNVYIADPGNDAIEEWDASTQQLTTLISSGLSNPKGVAVDILGNLYVLDSSQTVYEWNPSSQQMTALVSFAGLYPQSITVDGSGNVYVGDAGGLTISEWSASTQQISTFFSLSEFEPALAMALDGNGNFYFANGGIAEIPNVFVGPATVTEPDTSGSDSLSVIPTTAPLTGVFAPTSDSSWLTVGPVANGVVGFSFTADSGTNRTGHLNVLGQQITVNQNGMMQPQTITFPPIPNQTYDGGSSIQLNATASSGLPVRVFGSGACGVADDFLMILSAGTCGLEATQPGNAYYAPAPNVFQSFQVLKGTLTITFAAIPPQTVGTDITLSARATPLTLPVSFSSQTTSVCTVSGSTARLIGVGTCTIQATQTGNKNFNAATPVTQSFEVSTLLQQTISFGELPDVVGASPFAVSASATSGLSVGFQSLTPSICSTSGSTVTPLVPGACTIQASQVGDGVNYYPAPPVNQTFQVGSQFISFGPVPNQALSNPPLALSAVASSGLPVSFTSLAPTVCTITGSSLAFVSAGTCTIQASQAGNGNYAAAPPANQNFQVTTHPTTAVLGTYTIALSSAGGSSSVVLSSSGPWTATSNASFLHVSTPNASGIGSSVVMFTCDPFNGTGVRAGTLTIAGLILTVSQAGTNYSPASYLWLAVAQGQLPPLPGLEAPSGVAIDSTGNVYVADSLNSVDVWLTSTQQVSPLISGPWRPSAMAVDGFGNVFFPGVVDQMIDEWSPATEQITETPLVAAPIVATDSFGNVYTANSGYSIDEWNPSTQQVTTFNVPGAISIQALAFDASGDVYLADDGTQAIEEWNPVSQQLSTLVSGLSYPTQVTVDGSGNVYYLDNQTLYEWSPSTQQVVTPLFTNYSYGSGLAVDGSETLYFSVQGVNPGLMAYYNGYLPVNVTETPSAGSDSIPVLPATYPLIGMFALSSDSDWLRINSITNGVINVSFTANTTGAPRTAIISPSSDPIGTNFQFSITQNVVTNPTATFTGAPASAAYGSTFTVAATTNASTAPVITAAGPCTLTGLTVAITAPSGTCLLTANWAADANYFAASATQSTTATQATPAITWATPASITYGTALTAAQLDATEAYNGAAVAGTFTYNPPKGTVLTAGNQTLSVTFKPTNTTDYASATASVTLDVNPATPKITWAKPAAIAYGTALNGMQLDATASVPGAFQYNPAAGTVLTAGLQTLSVTFTPTDTTDYATITDTVTITVKEAAPTLTWAAPAPIAYGTALSSIQLDATASVPGSFVYSPVAGTVLVVGSHKLSVTFTPADTIDYSTATTSVTLPVNASTPTIAWATPAAITYGTALSGTQLDATATFNGATVAGTFTYSPAKGTVLTAGSQTLTVTFAPSNTVNYVAPPPVSMALQVNQATPKITWAKPAVITYGTALSSAQLDATASVPGTFVYSPASGTVLSGGTQTLSVTFAPTDAIDYAAASDSVTITMKQATSTTAISSSSPNPSQVNVPVTVNFTVSGIGGVPTGTITVTASTGQSCTGSLNSGAGSCSLTFTAAGSPKLTATYSGDTNFKTSTSAKFTQTVQ